ncbi:MAG: hypothetical protein WCH62_06845 [Candidatus Omnitrophota bacterium]
MVAGIPGTGIGGIFYLISALCMPLREITKVARGKSSIRRWKFIMMQLGLASGVICGFWITGWVLTMVLPHQTHKIFTSLSTANVLKIKPIVVSITVLIVVLLTAEFLGLILPKRRLR